MAHARGACCAGDPGRDDAGAQGGDRREHVGSSLAGGDRPGSAVGESSRHHGLFRNGETIPDVRDHLVGHEVQVRAESSPVEPGDVLLRTPIRTVEPRFWVGVDPDQQDRGSRPGKDGGLQDAGESGDRFPSAMMQIGNRRRFVGGRYTVSPRALPRTSLGTTSSVIVPVTGEAAAGAAGARAPRQQT